MEIPMNNNEAPLLSPNELGRVRRYHWFEETLEEPEKCYALHLIPGAPTGRELEENLLRLPNLQSLTLDGLSGIEEPPSAIAQLPKLQELTIYYCEDFVRLGNILPSLKHLRVFSLFGSKKIKALPPEISDIKTLEKLIADMGHLESLPDTLHLLPKLRELQFVNNQLTSLPKTLFQAPELEKLLISQHYTLKVPKEITSAKKLKKCYHGVLEIEGMTLDELKAAMPWVEFKQAYLKARPHPETKRN